MKTRSAAKLAGWLFHRNIANRRLAAGIVLASIFLAQLACAGGYVSPGSMVTPAVDPAQMVSTAQGSATPVQDAILTVETPASAIGGGILDPLPALETPVITVEAPANTAPTETSQPDLPIASTPAPVMPTASISGGQDAPLLYYTQAGDTLQTLAIRFNVDPSEITSPSKIPQEGLFDPGILLLIPQRLQEVSASKPLIPDSEVVYSPSTLDFDLESFVNSAGGMLKDYKEWRTNGWFTGAGVVQRVASENSINPRLLLAILEIQSHWVYGQPTNLAETDYPIGWLHNENEKKGAYYQLSWAVSQLNIGYYGWRDGSVTELTFKDGQTLRLAPDLNAGTVALMYLFSRLYNQQEWAGKLYGPDGLMVLYEKMFGNPWTRAQTVEPLFPATLTQPPLELPFAPGRTWSLTGGPHSAWGPNGARAAIDFAPSSTVHGCYESDDWVTASAAGLVIRSENGVVLLDLDGDGYEQTGWNILYLHIASKDRVAKGTFVDLNDPIGHPSCEGGVSNGTHVHIARKYNGEWILADGPMPFVLSGWRAHADKTNYLGTMTKDDLVVYASNVGSFESRITRPR